MMIIGCMVWTIQSCTGENHFGICVQCSESRDSIVGCIYATMARFKIGICAIVPSAFERGSDSNGGCIKLGQ